MNESTPEPAPPDLTQEGTLSIRGRDGGESVQNTRERITETDAYKGTRGVPWRRRVRGKATNGHEEVKRRHGNRTQWKIKRVTKKRSNKNQATGNVFEAQNAGRSGGRNGERGQGDRTGWRRRRTQKQRK